MQDKDDREIGPDGEVEKIEQVTSERFIKMIEPKIIRFKDGRFVYRVFVIRDNRSTKQLKLAALDLVKECVVRKHSHRLSKEEKQCSLYRNVQTCGYRSCPWKAVMILICQIENGLHDNVDVLKKYDGFVIVVAYSGIHRETKAKEFKIIEGFEDFQDLLINHSIPRNNLSGVPIPNKASVFKNPNEVQLAGEEPKLKFNLIEIPELKQLIRSYQNEKDSYNPTNILDFITKWIKDLKKVYQKDPVDVSNTLFADIMLDLWNADIFEDKHISYPNMAVDEHKKEQSICFDFELESGIQEKKLQIQIKCWDLKSAREYLNSTWKNFCQVANMIDENDIHPWINPSIEFTTNSKVTSTKRIHKDAKAQMQELERNIYRNGRKETIKHRQLKQHYEVLGNIMHVDNVHKDADFKSVPSKILDEKAMIIEKLKTARKEKENTHFIMCDSMDRYEEARQKVEELERKLKENDEIGVHWFYLGPTVIQQALKSQGIKVEQVHKFVGEKAQLKRCEEPDTYQNQYNQAINQLLPKFEDVGEVTAESEVEEQSEDFGSRMKEVRIAEKKEVQLKNKRPKGKYGKKHMQTPGMDMSLAHFKKRMQYFRGATIIMNPHKDKKIELIPEIKTAKGEPLGIAARNTSQVIQSEKMKEFKKMESPRNIRNSENDSLQREVDAWMNKKSK